MVQRLTPKLFARCRRAARVCGDCGRKTEAIICRTGFYATKPSASTACEQNLLVEKYEGKVPTRSMKCFQLPGRRKTAMLFGRVFHRPGISLSTPRRSALGRMGLTKEKTRATWNAALQKKKNHPRESLTIFSNRRSGHGRLSASPPNRNARLSAGGVCPQLGSDR